MTNEELKEVLIERMDANTTLMNAHFLNMDERLGRVEAQTTKTNGRVTQLEKDGLNHIITCPVKKEFDAYKEFNEKDKLEYSFFKKYPKALAGILLVMMLGLGTGVLASYQKLNNTTEQNKIIVERIDSLAKVNNIHFNNIQHK
jgi:hypothetical protein